LLTLLKWRTHLKPLKQPKVNQNMPVGIERCEIYARIRDSLSFCSNTAFGIFSMAEIARFCSSNMLQIIARVYRLPAV
jgi:hypothetical protein